MYRTPVANPKNSPTKRTKPIVPPVVMRPTISSASVTRPCAPSPAVAARRRIAKRPPAPAIKTPAPRPAATATVTFPR